MLVDGLIIILVITGVYRGRNSGFIRQLLASAGFLVGLLTGRWLAPHFVNLGHTTEARAVITVVVLLGSALVYLTLGEYVGLHFKRRLLSHRLNRVDNGLGSLLGVTAAILSIWLLAALVGSLPAGGFRNAVRSSHIVSGLNRVLPDAPQVIASLGRFIDPNGFPDVFIGNEPIPRGRVNLPALGDLAAAVNADKDSVLRIKGQGCGGVVSGSGFVIGDGLVATNAHVVAGIHQPYVQDVNGRHTATVIWFDPGLDFAVLRASGLAGKPLTLSSNRVEPGTPAAVLGYPGGGDFSANPAAVLDQIRASGRDIYGKSHTLRNVYEVQTTIVPGNSGGPLVAKDGSVIGVVFAESTSYDHVGYALTSSQVSNDVEQAAHRHQAVSTGQCAE